MIRNRVFTAVRELCTGCHICEQVCSLSKTSNINLRRARLRIMPSPKDPSYFPVICHHCKVPLCQKACPVPEAMYRDEKTGVVVVKETECIGCLACVEACPFGAIRVGLDQEILKCDLCGGDPLCVRYCPPRPENSLPHLPWPKQSCLQYVEPGKIGAQRRLSHALKIGGR